MKTKRNIIEVDEERCNGCGLCVPSCAEGAIQILNGKAKLVSESYCDGLGACLGECPQGALRVVERDADDFDPEAVEQYLEKKIKAEAAAPTMACGCSSSLIHVFDMPVSNGSESSSAGKSMLSHWPVQLRLVPANAPFLKGADLLVAADCTPVAYPNFHRDFVAGRAVLVGCPKFDDVDEYLKKLTEIFAQAGIRSITTLEMEVPCCSALPGLVKKAMSAAAKEFPFEEVVISNRGLIVSRKQHNAA